MQNLVAASLYVTAPWFQAIRRMVRHIIHIPCCGGADA